MGVIMRITFLILLHKFSSGLMKCSPLLSPTLSLDDIVNGAFYLTLAQYSLQARTVQKSDLLTRQIIDLPLVSNSLTKEKVHFKIFICLEGIISTKVFGTKM